ncbi:cytochrome B5 [Encephalitozoon intestinalis ATCC 50506]|uniref:Cytochrome B5 n=1 Tax=Encephalitozoon intestinalis (strain ATCC 50506) TaxID=876142 RepID=E0S5I1_ENCIT|nr:cytochrome B5 [Encephalitozoon intestinalis ATCC 50506]ADM10966.1 cytochrome B5 [Encephalitozoon intestinalis ATCC 50506]UTX44603.1 cytochrome B5 [Encephalitozoon intestinalis]
MNLIRWSRERRTSPSFRALSVEEVSKHNKLEDCWIIMDGTVYDVTDFLRVHPGGAETIMKYAGKDCTDAFNKAHSYVNKEELLFNSIVGVISRQ